MRSPTSCLYVPPTLLLLVALGCPSQPVSLSRSDTAEPTADAALVAPFPGLAAAPAPTFGPLQIHQINVQQGDCTLIIGPDGTTFLIDAGNIGKGASEVVPYLQSIGLTPAAGLDFVLATHGDQDHLGGLDEVLAVFPAMRAVWNNGSSKTGGEIDAFIAAAKVTPAGSAQAMELGHVVDLGAGATATCVAVGGQVLGHGQVADATEENDLSVAILVSYGGFEYLTAGDLGGGDADRSCTERSTDQADVETPLAMSLRSLTGANLLGENGLEVLDVNHHGSESSTNSATMNLLTPTVAVINTGPGQGSNYHHPRADVVVNVLMAQASSCIAAPPALVLQTDEGDPVGANATTEAFCVGDVVITTAGEGTFTISATARMKKGSDERLAAGIGPAGRTFPLDGGTVAMPTTIRISEIMRDPASVPDTAGEWFELFNPGTSPVDINGWMVTDDGNDSHRITSSGPLLVQAGGYFVLGRNGDAAQNGGFVAGYVYSGFNLANGEDEVVLLNMSGVVVDRVAYTGHSPWPSAAGASMSRVPSAPGDPSGDSWTASTQRGGTFNQLGFDLGTPGAAGTMP